MDKRKSVTKKDRITRLLKLDENGQNYYEELSTNYKRYNVVAKNLELVNHLKEAEEIFKWLYDKGTNLKSLSSKSRPKKEFEKDLLEIMKMQNDYYKEKLYHSVYERAIKNSHSWSDIDIVLREKEYTYSIPLSEGEKHHIFEIDQLLNAINDKAKELNAYIDKLLSLVFIESFDKSVPTFWHIDKFEDIIDESIREYNIVKKNKESLNISQSKNPFLILYMYLRNCYIDNYFTIDLPNKKYFEKCFNFNIKIEEKKAYSLGDISEYLAQLMSSDGATDTIEIKKCYERLKKCFQKISYIQEYREKKTYSFPDVVTPISYYLFYSRKDNLSGRDEGIWGYNKIVEYRIKPIIQLYIYKEQDKLRAVFKLIDFIEKEFSEIVDAKSHRYQSCMIDFWNEMIINIFYRISGLDSKTVYRHY